MKELAKVRVVPTDKPAQIGTVQVSSDQGATWKNLPTVALTLRSEVGGDPALVIPEIPVVPNIVEVFPA